MTTASVSAPPVPPPNYPSVSDYAEALQHPDRCFQDADLKACKTENDARGDPLPRTGGFAAVFKLIRGNKATAVKVFKNYNAQREQRYQTLSDYLGQIKSPHLVGFRYHSNGIRVNKQWFPILTMDWVEGLRLTNWVEQRLGQRDTPSLVKLAERWGGLISHLKTSKIAHGDLQHGNVLVVQQDLVLVDYDGMCVPALEGQEAWECGLPGYQHPYREGQPLSLRLDDFSAWIIWLALRSLAGDPTLWPRYAERIKEDNLLFSAEDVSRPEQSRLWPELLRLRDPDVVRRATELRDSIRKEFKDIPVFSLDRSRELLERLGQLCEAPGKDWEQIVRLADDMAQAAVALPPHRMPAVMEARRRLASRQKLADLIARRDPYLIKDGYEPALVDDWPACRDLVEEAKKSLLRVQVLDALKRALEKDDGRLVVELWGRHRPLLQGVPMADPIGDRAEKWRRRQEARDRMIGLLATPTSSEQSLLDAWNALQTVGGHPDIPADLPHRINQLRERVVLVADLRNLLRQPPGETPDRQFLAKWREDLLRDCPGIDDLRQHVHGGQDRLNKLDALLQVFQALDRRSPGQPIDDHVEQVALTANVLPRDYVHPRLNDVRQARDWLDGRKQLEDACHGGRWEDVAELSQKPEFKRWGPPAALAAHVEKTGERLRALRALQGALQAKSLRGAALVYSPDLLDDWPRYRDQVIRAREAHEILPLLPQLEAAMRNPGDGEPLLQLWEARPNWPVGWFEVDQVRKAVDEWRPRVHAWRALTALLADPDARARTIADAWVKFQATGDQRHPGVPRVREQAELAVRRADCLDRLAALPREASEEADRAFLSAWQEEVLGDWWEAKPLRYRQQAANQRVKILNDVDLALSQGDDERAVELKSQISSAYRQNEPRIQKLAGAVERIRLRLDLRRALGGKPILDVALAGVWEAFSRAGLSLSDPHEKERCLLAQRRREALTAYRNINSALPVDRQDGEVLLCWGEGDLNNCADVQPHERQRYEEAQRRTTRWRDLEMALNRRDHLTVSRLATDPLLAGHLTTHPRRDDLVALLRKGRHVANLLDVLEQRRAADQVTDLDLACVAEERATFQAHQQTLRALLQAELGRATLKVRGEPEVMPEADGTWRAVVRWGGWSWRRLGLGERTCRVAVDSHRFPDRPAGSRPMNISEAAYGVTGSLSLTPPAGAKQLYVTVWPVLRLAALGLEEVGAPLHIGPIQCPKPPRVGTLRRLLGQGSGNNPDKPAAAVPPKRRASMAVWGFVMAGVVCVPLLLRGWAEINAGEISGLVPPPVPVAPRPADDDARRTLKADVEQATLALRTGQPVGAANPDVQEVVRRENELHTEASLFARAYLEGCAGDGSFPPIPEEVKCQKLRDALGAHRKPVEDFFTKFPEEKLTRLLEKWLDSCMEPRGGALPAFPNDDAGVKFVTLVTAAKNKAAALLENETTKQMVASAKKPLQKWAKAHQATMELGVRKPDKIARLKPQFTALKLICEVLDENPDPAKGPKAGRGGAEFRGIGVAWNLLYGACKDDGLPDKKELDTEVVLVSKGAPMKRENFQRKKVRVVLEKSDAPGGAPIHEELDSAVNEFTLKNEQTKVLAALANKRKVKELKLVGYLDDPLGGGGDFGDIKPTPKSEAAHDYNRAFRDLGDNRWNKGTLERLKKLRATCVAHPDLLSLEKEIVDKAVEMAEKFPPFFK